MSQSPETVARHELKICWDLYMRSSNQILHGDQNRWEENIYMVYVTPNQPASVAQWAEAQCAPTGTVCRRGGVQSPGRPVDFVFEFQWRML